MNAPKPIPRLSGSALKVIAMVSMVTDHCAYYLLEHDTLLYEAMRCFGRIAFPVFAFLIAEGFRHTRNRIKYFLLLLGFAVISEVPWVLLNGKDGTHNVMFTLALGVVALAVFEKFREHRVACCCAIILLIIWLAAWLGVDYEWRGVLMVIIFYLLGHSDKHVFPTYRMLQLLFAFPLMIHYGVAGGLLACFSIFWYDGTRGFIHGSSAKYGFYAFYPLHLCLLYYFSNHSIF